MFGTLTPLGGSFIIGFVGTLFYYLKATGRTSFYRDKFMVMIVPAFIALFSMGIGVDLLGDYTSIAILFIGNAIGMIAMIVILSKTVEKPRPRHRY